MNMIQDITWYPLLLLIFEVLLSQRNGRGLKDINSNKIKFKLFANSFFFFFFLWNLFLGNQSLDAKGDTEEAKPPFPPPLSPA